MHGKGTPLSHCCQPRGALERACVQVCTRLRQEHRVSGREEGGIGECRRTGRKGRERGRVECGGGRAPRPDPLHRTPPGRARLRDARACCCSSRLPSATTCLTALASNASSQQCERIDAISVATVSSVRDGHDARSAERITPCTKPIARALDTAAATWRSGATQRRSSCVEKRRARDAA
eukprot:6173880-Pleurochrysis_carterae.AAC.2